MKTEENKKKSKLSKLIDRINDTYLTITCSFLINNYDFYLIPTICIGKVSKFHIVFYFLNIIFEIDFEINNYDN